MSTADTSQKLSPEDLRELEELHASFAEQAPASAAEQVSFGQVAVKVQAVKQLLLTLQKQQEQLAELLDSNNRLEKMRKEVELYLREEMIGIGSLKADLVVFQGDLQMQIDNEELKASIAKLKIQIAAAEERIDCLNPSSKEAIAEVRNQIEETKSSIRKLGVDV